jgi:hypothetical protein
MKKTIIFICTVLIFISCKEENNQDESVLIPKKNISNILNNFVAEDKCNECIYELYIDKKNPHYYELILYKGKKSLTSEENNYNEQIPISIVKLKSGIKFNIYSGIEHYFIKSDNVKLLKNERTKIIDSLNPKNDIEYKVWVVKDSMDVLTTTKRDAAYPFIPLPKGKIYFDAK